MSAMSGEQKMLDHFGVKILKPRHFLEPFTSTIFTFNFTTEYAQEIFVSAKESFSNMWGFSSKISINISISILFWIIVTLVDIFSSLNTKLLNYRRGDIPKRFMIKKKRTKLRQSRSLVVITLLIIALTMLDTSHINISESKLNDTSLISTELNVSAIYLISKGKSLRPNFLLIFLICGDVNPNPGPTVKIPCSQCLRTIAKNHRSVKCEKCELTFHIKCANMKPGEFLRLKNDETASFYCQFCLNNTLPFASQEENDTHIDEIFLEAIKELNLTSQSKLNIGHLNMNGLRSKIDFLRVFLQENPFDVFCLNETKIDSGVCVLAKYLSMAMFPSVKIEPRTEVGHLSMWQIISLLRNYKTYRVRNVKQYELKSKARN